MKTAFSVTGFDDASAAITSPLDALSTPMISSGGNDEAQSDSKHAARVRAPLRVEMAMKSCGVDISARGFIARRGRFVKEQKYGLGAALTISQPSCIIFAVP
jgi:hypothetical protein